jgi:hypothetical protein
MSAVACCAEPNLGRKIPENLSAPNSGEAHRQYFLARILTATRREMLTMLGGLLE